MYINLVKVDPRIKILISRFSLIKILTLEVMDKVVFNLEVFMIYQISVYKTNVLFKL